MTFVQAATGNGSAAATVSAQFTTTPTAGRAIVACVHIFRSGGAPTSNTVTDDGGNSYTLLQAESAGGGGINSRFECYLAINIAGVAAHDVIFTPTSGTIDAVLTITEWAGTAAAGALQTSNISTIANTTGITGTAIVASGAGMHVTFAGWDSFAITHTPAAGWTEAIEASRGGGFLNQAISYRTAAGTVSQTPGGTLSSNAGFGRYIHLVLLDTGGGGGGGAATRGTLMGVLP